MKKYINKIDMLVNKAIKEIKIANTRAESAEKLIEEFRLSAQKEINNAFNNGFKRGYEKALNDINSGGSSKNKDDDVKLVLKNNN